jgi:hypothetical protein
MKIYFVRISLLTALLFSFAAVTIAQKTPVKKAVPKKPVAQKTTVQKTTVQKPVISTSTPAGDSSYSNGIQLNVKGFTVKEAYLVFDDEKRVSADNTIDLSQQVSLRIILTTGFKEINGKVFPGGSEKIMLSTGEKILESDDLFTAYDAVGVSPVDAKYITLKAVITGIKDKNNAVIVSVKVWDKKTDANEITGSYTLHIK